MITGSDIKKTITKTLFEHFNIMPIWDEAKEGFKRPAFFAYFLNFQIIPTSNTSFRQVYPIEIQYLGKSNNDALAIGEELYTLLGHEIEVNNKHLQITEVDVDLRENSMWYSFNVEISRSISRRKDDTDKMMKLNVEVKEAEY